MKKSRFPPRKRILIPLAVCIFLFLYFGCIVLETRTLLPRIPQMGSNDFIREKLKLDSWLPLAGISDPAIAAVVVSEDANFFRHHGYEAKSIQNAAKTNLFHFRFKRGASTITQQVVKNVLLDRRKTVRRKLEELILARRLEESFGKARIMEIYLNTAQFGTELYGIGPASAFYFNKPANRLTPKEGAFLATLLPSPARYEKSFRERKLTRYARRTIASILKRMADEGFLPAGEAERESKERLSFEDKAAESDPAS